MEIVGIGTNVVECVRIGNDKKAYSILLENFERLQFKIDQSKISTILGLCFLRRANEDPGKAEESLGAAGAIHEEPIDTSLLNGVMQLRRIPVK